MSITEDGDWDWDWRSEFHRLIICLICLRNLRLAIDAINTSGISTTTYLGARVMKSCSEWIADSLDEGLCYILLAYKIHTLTHSREERERQ